MIGGPVRQVARHVAVGAGITTAVTGATVTVYACSEQGLGFRRELRFWGVVSPIIFDYWWHASSTSPYVKYQKWLALQKSSDYTLLEESSQEEKDHQNNNNYVDDVNDDDHISGNNNNKFQQLHQRNAPRMFQVMLDLGGLYIKLGQVLSVTALPIPEEYRVLFQTLQSNVPGHAEFETVVKPTLEQELKQPLDQVFASIEEIPCGAASIGQAHKAVLRSTGDDVIVKVQYPNARWQVPADIQCVGDFLRLCVYFGLVDETASKISYQEFARQFLSELEYEQERDNLQQVYESSLDPQAPYLQRGVVVPRVFPEFCTNRVITMTYLPGPKFEEEAKRQLAMVGIDTKRNIRDVVAESSNERRQGHLASAEQIVGVDKAAARASQTNTMVATTNWKVQLSQTIVKWIGVDSVFSMLRIARKLLLWSRAAAVTSIQAVATVAPIPTNWQDWAKHHEDVALQAARLNWTYDAVYALLDVHGYQIFNQGLFNADPHPGNLLIVQDDTFSNSSSSKSSSSSLQYKEPKIGLIDYGQCKRLTLEERIKVARLLLSVADNAPDETVASHFRDLGIQTKNDSTRFLAEFARLMFGSFQPEHLNHSWHRDLHQEDKVLYFPNELSMVYRTSILLRGLAMSLQLNVSVGEQWRHHAQSVLDRAADEEQRLANSNAM